MSHTHPSVYQRGTCRACRSPLTEVLSLGPLRLNAFPAHPWEVEQIPRVPLILMVCQGCGLTQLDRTVPPDWMFRNYWYRSGVNETMIAELQGLVADADRRRPGAQRVLDIGANDGTLLSAWGTGVERVGVEPALNLHDRLRQHCDVLIPDYFPSETPAALGRFDVITAIAMCYDLEQPVKFFQSIHDLLTHDGLAIVQFQDLEQQLRAAAFDNICHEHLEYYTLWALQHVLRQAGLMVEDVTHSSINGGSLRVYLRRVEGGYGAHPDVAMQMLREAQAGLDTPTLREGHLGAFTTFRNRVEAIKVQVRTLVEDAQAQGVTIDVCGASTKGNVLLQVLELGPQQIRQAIERSPEKVGTHTVTGIPIVGEAAARTDPAGLWLCPIWQFKAGLIERSDWYLAQGGTLVFPLPSVDVVRQRGEG